MLFGFYFSFGFATYLVRPLFGCGRTRSEQGQFKGGVKDDYILGRKLDPFRT